VWGTGRSFKFPPDRKYLRWAQAVKDRQVINDLEKHITFDKPHIYWRFDDKLDVLNKIKVIDEAAASLIWDRLNTGNFITDYALNKDRFDTFETIEFADNYDSVTKRLKELAQTNDNIVLTWFSAQHTLLIDLKTFTDNWDDFFYPSSDDLVVIHKNWDWIIYIAHFESFQIGQGIKTK
jgi:hypothetical protein